MGVQYSNTRISNQEMERINVSVDELNRFGIEEGDLIFSRTSMMEEGAGNVSIVLNHSDPIIFDGNLLCARLDKKIANPEFYFYYFRTGTAKQEILKITTGTQSRNIAASNLVKVFVPHPNLNEQVAITRILSDLDSKIDLNQRMNKTLEAIGQAVFKRWFVDFEFPNEEGKPYKSNGGSFADSERGKIPMGWETGRLGDICEITMGQSPPGETYNETEEGVPFFQGIRDFGFRFPSKRVYCTAATRFAKESDVLLSVRAPVGSLNVAQEACAIGRGVAAIRLKGKQNGFLYYLLLSTRSSWDKYESEGTVFGSATKQDVNDFQIVIPPKNLRDQFGELIEPLDKRILLNEKASRTLTAIRDSLLPRLMSGKIRVPVLKENVKANDV